MLKRIGLFLLTNLAILILLNIILFILERYFGLNITALLGSYTGILIFAAIIGFTGSFISLFISKWMAKRTHKMKLLTKDSFYELNEIEKFVFSTVEVLSERNKIKLPEIGIYVSDEANAFATGPSKNNSLVAVSTGLLRTMDNNQVEAIIAHEIGHIVSGDMVTMTLIQGVINTFVIFFARIIANIIDSYLEEGLSGIGYFVVNIALQMLFGVFASIIVMKFSRYREFKADEKSAILVGKTKMISALEGLKNTTSLIKGDLKLSTMKINDKRKKGFMNIFASHPSLDDRIKNLENLKI